jgi:hypothetical protein
MNESNEMIRERGLQALRNELGQAGMLKFMRHFVVGKGDYTKERVAWAEGVKISDLRKELHAKGGAKKRKVKK